MKKIKSFFYCLTNVIKKYIFKETIADIYHDCEKLVEKAEDAISSEELEMTEEYTLKYNTTTRWQTL